MKMSSVRRTVAALAVVMFVLGTPTVFAAGFNSQSHWGFWNFRPAFFHIPYWNHHNPPVVVDRTPPTISNISVTNLSTSSAIINWDTNESAGGKVLFSTWGTTGDKTGVSGVTSQSVTLSGLIASTRYSYTIVATDDAGNTSTSHRHFFFTLANPIPPPPPLDTIAPIISGITVDNVSSTSARISWQTNELAAGKLRYSTGSPISILASTVQSATSTLTQQLTPTSLIASTTYNFAIVATDIAGNIATSSINSFNTLQLPTVVPPPVPTTAQFGAATLPFSGNWDIQPNVVLWQNTLYVGSGTTTAMFIGFYASGTFSGGDIANIRFLVDDVISESTTTPVAPGGVLAYFRNSPMSPGPHKIQLIGNIVGGEGKAISFFIPSSNRVRVFDPISNSWLNVDSVQPYPLVSGPLVVNISPSPTPIPQLSLVKHGAYADQIVTAPQGGFMIGKFRLTAGAGESVILGSAQLKLTGIFPFSSTTDIFLNYGGSQSATYSNSTSTMVFSLASTTLAASGTMDVSVYASLPANIASGAFIGTLLKVNGVGSISGTPTSTNLVGGQIITVGAGNITVQPDASMPISSLVVGGTRVKIGSYKFTATNDSYTIDSLAVQTLTGLSSDISAITDVVFKDGSTELTTMSLVNGYATATGLSINIPANSTKIIDAYVDISSIGTGGAPSGANVGLKLSWYRAFNSGLVVEAHAVNIVSYSFYAYKTEPTISAAALPTTILSNGVQTISKFTVTADAAGVVAWRKIRFIIASSSEVFLSGVAIYDDADQSIPLINTSCVQQQSSITCSSTQDQEVSGSKTYVLKGTVTGTLISGSFISTYIPSASSGLPHFPPSNAAAVFGSLGSSFIWSDESVTPHDGTTNDWNNDFLVKNLPTDPQVMTN